MKTKQEQIVAIADVLCDYCKNNTKEGEYCKSSNGTYMCTSEIWRAEAIVQAGYGDVSEYKAEIEQLKTDFITLECNYDKIYDEHKGLKIENENLKTLNNKLRECIDYLKAEIKHTKIDMLNELKKKTHNYYPSIDSYCISQHVVLVRDIDELIKEVDV